MFRLLQRKLVVLAIEFKHVSKIGTLILLNPHNVKFLAAPVTGAYGLNFFVLKSVYVSNIVSLFIICSVTPCHQAAERGAPAGS
jgi:hypothetical protein